LALGNDDVVNLLQQFDNESKALQKELLEITWYMRGGVSYSEATMLSPQERKQIAEIIKQNIKNTNDTKLPLV
jgi:Icc-related predicted phosphoesterase|tara:strand:- start:426 stop:644 length:219 start_codon:yes stop_codon:yes gene_type:complete